MLRENEFVGCITIYRKQVRPFTEKQIELVQNFAAQAVIAIENTRLLNELRETLQQQTATSEVLSVISSSPGELKPVFQAMLEKATRVCEAKFGMLFRIEASIVIPTASYQMPKAFLDFIGPGKFRPTQEGPIMRAGRTKKIAHIVDFTTE